MSQADLIDLPTVFDLEMEDGTYQSYEAIVIVADDDKDIYMALQEVPESDEIKDTDVMLVQLKWLDNGDMELITLDDETFERVLPLFMPEFAKLYPDLDALPVDNSEEVRRYIDLAPYRVN